MTSILVCSDPAAWAVSLVGDLAQAGLTVLQPIAPLAGLALAVQRQRPDVLVCHVVSAGDALYDATCWLAANAPCAVLVLSASLGAAEMAASAGAGVHAYLPGCTTADLSAQRLGALVQLAQSRFKHHSAMAQSLRDALSQLEDRKVVDHAKTILMRARQLSDDDAFRMMRTASMHSNQRLAVVSGHIIHAARFADGVNRAGQLRMLSQRLIKLYALQLLQGGTSAASAFKDSVKRVDDNLTVLEQNFGQPELAVLVKQADATWGELKRKLKRPPLAADMPLVDALAEALLVHAEQLTGQLENTGSAQPLQVLNLAGRQRMLTQRFAKCALLQALGKPGNAASLQGARASFEAAQHYLNNIPLSTPEIGRLLATAKLDWQRLLEAVEQINTPLGRLEVEFASEAMLTVFEQLSATYASSMQMLMG